jgi:hypothetical protein
LPLRGNCKQSGIFLFASSRLVMTGSHCPRPPLRYNSGRPLISFTSWAHSAIPRQINKPPFSSPMAPLLGSTHDKDVVGSFCYPNLPCPPQMQCRTAITSFPVLHPRVQPPFEGSLEARWMVAQIGDDIEHFLAIPAAAIGLMPKDCAHHARLPFDCGHVK